MTNSSAWSHLPNAALIDEVLASLKTSPDRWATARDAVRGAVRGAAWDAAWDAARSAAWGAIRGTTWSFIWDALQSAAEGTARSAAWNALLALIAYDDAGQFIKRPVSELQMLYRLHPHPMYLLLQPAAAAFKEKS